MNSCAEMDVDSNGGYVVVHDCVSVPENKITDNFKDNEESLVVGS